MEISKIEIVKQSQQSIKLKGKKFDYQFFYEVGTYDDGATTITSYAYTAEGKNRPVLFLTNGGPGSGVVWLHIGFCAPERVHIEDDLHPQMTPPFTLEDNPNTLIDVCDLVFLDPPGCGYSRLNKETSKDYTSVDGDAAAVAKYIERWRIEHRLTNRPLYFMGESYGTVRGPALVDALMGSGACATGRLTGISLDGIILLGSVVSAVPFDRRAYQPIPSSVMNLECCAAAYAYHTGKDPYKYAKEALDYAPKYVAALYSGNSLAEKERKAVANKIHSLTGIPVKRLLQDHLAYTMPQFLNETFEGKSIGFYDGRYILDGKGAPQDKPMPGYIDALSEDAAMGQYSTAFIAGQELLAEKYDLPKEYYPLINCDVNKAWDRHGRRSSLASLENGQRRNKEMRILFCNGLLDMCTVPGGVHYAVNQSTLDLDRVEIKEYVSGHMAYLGEENAKQMSEDIRKFITKK